MRLQEESAEISWVRTMPQQDTYTYQMSHFAHEFTNFLQATSDRHAHIFLANRNFSDNLYWMESHFRRGKITQREREIFIKDGILLHRDKVKGLGEFTEFYGTKAMQEADLLEQAYALGFSESDLIRTSYLTLYLENAKNK